MAVRTEPRQTTAILLVFQPTVHPNKLCVRVDRYSILITPRAWEGILLSARDLKEGNGMFKTWTMFITSGSLALLFLVTFIVCGILAFKNRSNSEKWQILLVIAVGGLLLCILSLMFFSEAGSRIYG